MMKRSSDASIDKVISVAVVLFVATAVLIMVVRWLTY